MYQGFLLIGTKSEYWVKTDTEKAGKEHRPCESKFTRPMFFYTLPKISKTVNR